VDAAERLSAERLRQQLAGGRVAPEQLREALLRVSPRERDAWLDFVLELELPPEDGPELPRGGVPYLPCRVDALLSAIDAAHIRSSDVFVDVGSGVGRAGALVWLLTGAQVLGIEVQPALLEASRQLMARLGNASFTPVGEDARRLPSALARGTVFFLYCPFGGSGLETFLGGLAELAKTRELRLCLVDLPLAPRAWLRLASQADAECAVYRTTLHVAATRA
jgi:hypothetical protein